MRNLRPLTCVCIWAALMPWTLPAQTCTFTLIGVNDQRRVKDAIHAECPGSIHTAPFGNWGVTSNYGKKHNGHQFDGWCHDSVVCDNYGNCKTDCQDGWYEWNSCTDIAQYRAPNCYLYNSADCTEQVSSTGQNILGTISLSARVNCPYDSDGDGLCDRGGCLDVRSITAQNNYMSLYELDPFGTDSLVQSVYFGPTTVYPSCDAWRCSTAASNWATPTAYDTPTWPPKVDAQVLTWENGAKFSDPYRTCSYYAQFDARYRCY